MVMSNWFEWRSSDLVVDATEPRFELRFRTEDRFDAGVDVVISLIFGSTIKSAMVAPERWVISIFEASCADWYACVLIGEIGFSIIVAMMNSRKWKRRGEKKREKRRYSKD